MARYSRASLCLVAFTLLVIGGPTSSGADPVPKAFVLYPGIGYFKTAVSDTYNWTQSLEYCITQKGHLAVPNSEAEANVYKELIADVDDAYQNIIYIGFHDLFDNGEYETVQDTPLSTSGYTRWALGAPNISPTLRCGGFSKDGGLLNLNCALAIESTILCELPLWYDYELVPEIGYFKFHVDAKTWPEAWKTCRAEKSHLAVINNEEEYIAMQEIFDRFPIIPEADYWEYAWVGVHAKFEYNKFRTVTGITLDESGYDEWELGYPDFTYDNSLIDVALTNSNGSLIALEPETKLAFFCEHDL